MRQDLVSRATRRVGGIVGVTLLVLGAAELIVRLDRPLALVFWLPTLWGGGILILVGALRPTLPPRLSAGLVLGGAALALPATVWTLVIPLLIVALAVLVVVRSSRQVAERRISGGRSPARSEEAAS